MTYEELVNNIQKANEKVDASKVKEHVAIEFDIRGAAEGAFYVEIREQQVYVEPYEYYDRDAIVTTTAITAEAILTGELGVEAAYMEKRIHVIGNLDKVYLLDEIVRKKRRKHC